MMRSKLFESLLQPSPNSPALAQKLLPQLPEERGEAKRTLMALGLSSAEADRQVERLDRLTFNDCLLEAKAWNFLAERTDSVREAVRSGLLLGRLLRSCAVLEATAQGQAND